MSYSQAKELELLKNKLDQLKKIGCTGFAVSKMLSNLLWQYPESYISYKQRSNILQEVILCLLTILHVNI